MIEGESGTETDIETEMEEDQKGHRGLGRDQTAAHVATEIGMKLQPSSEMNLQLLASATQVVTLEYKTLSLLVCPPSYHNPKVAIAQHQRTELMMASLGLQMLSLQILFLELAGMMMMILFQQRSPPGTNPLQH